SERNEKRWKTKRMTKNIHLGFETDDCIYSLINFNDIISERIAIFVEILAIFNAQNVKQYHIVAKNVKKRIGRHENNGVDYSDCIEKKDLIQKIQKYCHNESIPSKNMKVPNAASSINEEIQVLSIFLT